MGFIRREINRIHAKLIVLGEDEKEYVQLYAARQALEWVLEPTGVKAPYEMIMGTQEEKEGCLAEDHLPLS